MQETWSSIQGFYCVPPPPRTNILRLWGPGKEDMPPCTLVSCAALGKVLGPSGW